MDETTWKLWKLLDRGDLGRHQGNHVPDPYRRTYRKGIRTDHSFQKASRPCRTSGTGWRTREVTYRKRHLDLISNEESALPVP